MTQGLRMNLENPIDIFMGYFLLVGAIARE